MGWSGPLSSVLTNPLLSSHLECLHWLGAGPPSGDPNHPALGWAPAVCCVVRPPVSWGKCSSLYQRATVGGQGDSWSWWSSGT